MRRLITTILLLLIGVTAYSQKAVKAKKQQTTFFYLQGNVHFGYMHDAFGERLDCAAEGSKNQLAFQLFGKSKGRLQRGYIPLISLTQWKVRMSARYDHWVGFLGRNDANAGLKLLDAWVRFDTKWDRTRIILGYSMLPFGRNPQIDPVSGFLPSIMTTNIGMAADLGVFVRTPVSKKLDLDFAFTSGGLLNSNLITCINLASNEGVNNLPSDCMMIDLDLKNLDTWLISGRLGSASFNKNEFGLLAMGGTISGILTGDDENSVFRVGGEWIYKHKERFMLINQATIGQTLAPYNETYNSFSTFTSAEVFLHRRVALSGAFLYSVHNDSENAILEIDKRIYGSVAYTVSPHTKIRLNQYFRYNSIIDQDKWGVFLQLVTGIGKRP